MKRAQSLPLNTIVLAAIAVLVLVLIVAFTTGSLTELFKPIGERTKKVELDSIKMECYDLCSDLKTAISDGRYTSVSQVENSAYARTTFAIDLNNNNEIENNEKLHCWQSPINVPCNVRLTVYEGGIRVTKICSGTDSGYKCQ